MTAGRQVALALAVWTATIAASGTARACAFDDEPDPDFTIDTLDHYYPGGYTVFVKVADARREGLLQRYVRADADKPEMRARLIALAEAFERQVRAAARARAPAGTPPAFSLLLLDSMMWSHFSERIATEPAEIHTQEPKPGDLIVIASDDAIAAVAAGRLQLADLEQRGWLRYYGSGPGIARFRLAFARVGIEPAKPNPLQKDF